MLRFKFIHQINGETKAVFQGPKAEVALSEAEINHRIYELELLTKRSKSKILKSQIAEHNFGLTLLEHR
jgi:hypothetical protein